MTSQGRDKFADIPTLQGARRAPSVSLPRFELVVAAGPDSGKRFALDPEQPNPLLVGKSPACGLQLSDPEVSRRHAALEIQGTELHVTDLRSTNGTFVNGLRVYEAGLVGGESIRVGATELVLRRTGEVSATDDSAESGFGRLIGASPEMRRLYPLCWRLAAAKIPVIIEGETGTGKEILAEALHECGPRAAGPFVVFDCTAVTPNLLEAAIFGHEKGAFTGALMAREGVFEQAAGGTLFIDEIGDLDLGLQAKLLRALERSEVQRLGSNRWSRVDVRVIAATRRDLDEEVQAGRFRDDLFFRIAVGRIALPPLRKRTGDIRLLATHFWQQLGGAGAPPLELFDRFERYVWPGNVRELYNAVARFLTVGDLSVEAISPPAGGLSQVREARRDPDPISRILALGLPLPRARSMLVAEFERRYVERVLAEHGGDVSEAARASGIARRYFQLLRARQSRPTEDPA